MAGGLLFEGLYGRHVPAADVLLLRVEDARRMPGAKVVEQLRPSPLEDITDEPVSEISPGSWHSRQPVIFLTLQPLGGGPPVQRAMRLKRETPVQWIEVQPGVFRIAFVQREEGSAACVIELWETLVLAASAPWPDGRGDMRRGRRNPLSRERRG